LEGGKELPMLLEVKNIKVHYGNAEALRGISQRVDEGEIITLIGANGAGKTTTLRTISGLVKPTSGEIWFEGKRIDKMPPYAIVKLGIVQVPEGRRVLPTMTVLENLEIGAYLRKDKRAVAKDLDSIYERFPFLKMRHGQAAGSLSGGEQQMLAVGRALMASPKILLLDEPSLGLSPIMVDEIGAIIGEINRTGVTIILVEQNAYMALALADRAYIIEVGTITLEGNAQKLAKDESVIKAYLGG
jgi:branched-chain amino acid transport system ATP-binding protein